MYVLSSDIISRYYTSRSGLSTVHFPPLHLSSIIISLFLIESINSIYIVTVSYHRAKLHPVIFVVVVQLFAFLGVCTCLSLLLEVLLKVLYLHLLLPNLCFPGILSRGLSCRSPTLGPHSAPLWTGCFPGCWASCLSLAFISLPGMSAVFLGPMPSLPLFWIIVILHNNSSLFQICSIGICTTYRPSGAEKMSLLLF